MKLNTSTIIRIIVLLVSLINMGLTAFGLNPIPFSNEEVYYISSFVVTVIAALVTMWKNNDFTAAAKWGTKVMNGIKSGELTVESVEDFLSSKVADDE